MSLFISRQLNALALLAISLVLLTAYYFQFVHSELPCPLCLLQRIGMAAIMFGFMLNLRFEIKPSHYAIILISAIFGSSVAIRQILLHIDPSSSPYGSALWGLHFYTWSLIVFIITSVFCCFMLFDSQFSNGTKIFHEHPFHGWTKWLSYGAFLLVIANTVTTLLECGVWQCADNPVYYRWLG